MTSDISHQAFKIADKASASLVECTCERIDAWTYYISPDVLADEAIDEAVTYLVARGLAHILESGVGWHVILETDE